MKYLEIESINRLNLKLAGVATSDCTRLFGRVEAYSCKPAGEDKKLYKLIEQKYGCETTIIRRLLYTNHTPPNTSSEDEDGQHALNKNDVETPSSPRKRPRTMSAEFDLGTTQRRTKRTEVSGISKRVKGRKGKDKDGGKGHLKEMPNHKEKERSKTVSPISSRTRDFDLASTAESLLTRSHPDADPTDALPMTIYSSSAPDSHVLRSNVLTTVSTSGHTRTITRKTFDHTAESLQLYYLLGTLQLAEPDFDCSSLHPSHFVRSRDLKTCLLGVEMGAWILECVWDVLGRNEEECSVFTLSDEGLLDDGVPDLWRKRMFVLNKRRKRVIYITLRKVPILQAHALESPWQSSTPRSPSLFEESADEGLEQGQVDVAGRMLVVN